METHTTRGGYAKKKDRDVRDEGKGLRRGGVQGQERRDKERTDETTGAGEKEITAGSDRVVEINVARLIGATEECACGLSGSQLAASRVLRQSRARSMMRFSVLDRTSAGRATCDRSLKEHLNYVDEINVIK